MLPIANRKRSSVLRRLRRGVSLLEVLISIFVLMVGLLGVAALLPVGRHHMAEAIRTDRAAACGRAILHEAKIRKWIDPTTWRTRTGGYVHVEDEDGNQKGIPYQTYVIDPLFIANNPTEEAESFPYDSSSSGMVRVTLASVYNSDSAIHRANAQQLCVWHDDLMFAPSPGDSEGRPRAMVLTGDTSPPSIVLWTNGTNVLKEENEGNYTWLLTVTPRGKKVTIAGQECIDLDQSPSFQVSVVVFFKRDLVPSRWTDPIPERMASPIGTGGIGGGDVALDDADVKQDEWVLVGETDHPYEWYRVVAADEGGASPRNVTLAGPDWPTPATQAAVVSGIIGVYTATCSLESRN